MVECIHESPLPVYRKPWNEDNLIGWEALGSSLIKKPEDKKWFVDEHKKAAHLAAEGRYVDWELHVAVGQKPSRSVQGT